MQAVFLDKSSLDRDDLDFTALRSTASEWQFYELTTKQDVYRRTEQAEVIVSNKVIIDKSVMENAQNLKLICVAATGTNNVDLEYAREKGITVCNVRAYGTSSVVQHVFTLLLMLLRNIPRYQAAVKRGDWQNSRDFCLLDYPIEELTDKTMGIIGFGELGQAVAKMAEAFSMRVLIANRKDKPVQTKIYKVVEMDRLLAEADVLSLHCPLTQQTRNLIAAAQLKQMKNTAYLVNMARGGIVDEVALKDALLAKEIAGAAIDVLAEEPPQKDSVLMQLDLPNLIITPHIAWASRRARQALLDQVAKNIEDFYSGSSQNVVV